MIPNIQFTEPNDADGVDHAVRMAGEFAHEYYCLGELPEVAARTHGLTGNAMFQCIAWVDSNAPVVGGLCRRYLCAFRL